MSDIEKVNPEDAMAAMLSFSDPNILTSIMGQLGWSFSVEIEETIKLAQQSENLSIKLRAIKHLRELLNDAAEKSGMVADVSRTIPGDDGSHTTYHAKQMAAALSPVPKQVKSKVIEVQENEQEKEIHDGTSPGEPTETSAESPASVPGGDGQDSGGLNGGGGPDGIPQVGRGEGDGQSSTESVTGRGPQEGNGGYKERIDAGGNPCVDNKPPTGVNPELFRGVTGAPEDGGYNSPLDEG